MDSSRPTTASGGGAASPRYSWLSGEARVEEVPRMVARLREAGKETGATLQMLRADLLAGPGHLHAAVQGATRSWRSGRPIARDLAMELLVYASGQRQIQRALELGLCPGRDTYVLVALCPEGGGSSFPTEPSSLLRFLTPSRIDDPLRESLDRPLPPPERSPQSPRSGGISGEAGRPPIPLEPVPGDPLAYHPGKREAICRYYGITPREIVAAGGEEKIPDLVVERVVLVDLLK